MIDFSDSSKGQNATARLPQKNTMTRAATWVAVWSAGLLTSVALSMAVVGTVDAASIATATAQGFSARGGDLTLTAAEQLALSLDPLLGRSAAMQKGLEARAIAAGTLPDPKLKFGIMNISAESFAFDQEPMTQAVFGVTQTFPPAGLRGAAASRFNALAESQGAALENRERYVRKKVRHTWLDLYFQQEAKTLVKGSQDVFIQLAKITQYQYRAGRGTQQHVVRAQLEHSLLVDRETEFETKREQARVSLEKWIGSISGLTALKFPRFPSLNIPPFGGSALSAHPSLHMLRLKMQAAEHGVSMEKSRKNPAWMLDVSYGYREAERDDLFSAMVKLDLPLFTGARQDQLVAAGQERLTATQLMLNEKHRNLEEMLAKSAAAYRRTTERMEYFTASLLPQAKQNTEAALNAYQSGVSDFGILVRARLTELNSRLKFLRLKVDHAKANVDIVYLIGESRI